jgi:hypothetical protein
VVSAPSNVRYERHVVFRVRVLPWSHVAVSHVHADAHSAAAVDFYEYGGRRLRRRRGGRGFVACTGEGEDGGVWEGGVEGAAEVVGEGGRGYDEVLSDGMGIVQPLALAVCCGSPAMVRQLGWWRRNRPRMLLSIDILCCYKLLSHRVFVYKYQLATQIDR